MLAAGIGTGVWLTRGEPPAPGSASDPHGEARRYRLDFASSDRSQSGFGLGVAPGGDEDRAVLSARLQLDVELVVERIAGDRDEIRRVFRFIRCERGLFSVGDTEIFSGPEACEAELVGPALVIDYGKDGALLRIHEPADGPALFGKLAPFVLSEISFWTPSNDVEAEIAESNLRGVALSRYEPQGDDEWLRTRERYRELAVTAQYQAPVRVEVAGRHRVRLDGTALEEFVGAETVRVKDPGGATLAESLTRIELRYTDSMTSKRAEFDPARFDTRALTDAPLSEELEYRMLVRQAAGLSGEEFLSTLSRFGDSGRLPDHDRFLWRSYALLQLKPELARDLISVFEAGNSNARTLVVDLLAQVGHPEAQAALVELLQGTSAREDPKAVELHQRLSFVTEPEPATVAYAEQRYNEARREADGQWHYASAYSLGALARHAGGATGERLRATLSEELASASDPVAIRHFVTALGATHAEEAVSQIAGYASADDPDVRAAVATSLKAPQTGPARGVLLDLLADDDRLTQHQAIRSLQRHPLEETDLEAIAARVSMGAVYPSNFRVLVELAKRFRSDAPEGSAMVLREMIAFGIPDNQVNAAAHLLLGRSP